MEVVWHKTEADHIQLRWHLDCVQPCEKERVVLLGIKDVISVDTSIVDVEELTFSRAIFRSLGHWDLFQFQGNRESDRHLATAVLGLGGGHSHLTG